MVLGVEMGGGVPVGRVVATAHMSAGHAHPPDCVIGSPETVAQKIAANLTALGATRCDLKYGMRASRTRRS